MLFDKITFSAQKYPLRNPAILGAKWLAAQCHQLIESRPGSRQLPLDCVIQIHVFAQFFQ